MLTEPPTYYFLPATPSLLGPLLLGPFVLGLIIYIYAFCSQSAKRRSFGHSLFLSIRNDESLLRGVQHTHICLFVLLLSDAFTAIFGTLLGVFMLTSYCGEQNLSCVILANVWLAFRWLSLSQHLIMALISVLFIYRPKYASGLRFAGKVLEVPPFLFVLLAFRVDENVLIGLDIFNLLLMLAIAVSCLLSATTMTTTTNQRKAFGLLAVLTYVFVCLPNSVLECMYLHSPEYLPLSVDVTFLTNFYFILDALLFYFTLKMNDEEQRECDGAIRCA